MTLRGRPADPDGALRLQRRGRRRRGAARAPLAGGVRGVPRAARAAAGGGHDDVPQHACCCAGRRTILVDPGLPLQNDPALRALEARGLSPADVDLVVLTHAHLDHAGGCAVRACARGRPRARDGVGVLAAGRRAPRAAAARAARRVRAASWRPASSGRSRPATATGTSAWPSRPPAGGSCCAATPSARAGTSSTPWRRTARRPTSLLASWRRIRAWDPALIIAGHLPPFAPVRPRGAACRGRPVLHSGPL